MQHKQGNIRLGGVLAALGVVIVIAIAVLMTRDVPVTQHAIEKQLDAKAFLEQKP